MTRRAGGRATLLDVDDTARAAQGYAEQAAGSGCSGQQGLDVQLATIGTPGSAPVNARARLRRGSRASATGVGRLLVTARTPLPPPSVDAALWCHAGLGLPRLGVRGTAVRRGITCPVTVRHDLAVRVATVSIVEDARIPVSSWRRLRPC